MADDGHNGRDTSQSLAFKLTLDDKFDETSSRQTDCENGAEDAVVGSFTDAKANPDTAYSEEESDGVVRRLKSSLTHPLTPERDRKNDCHAVKRQSNEWSYKEFLIDRRQHRSRSMVSVIKTEYVDDPALCNLTEFDSDDNLDEYSLKETKRKRVGRELRKTLSLQKMTEQQEKTLSEDFSVMNIGDPLDHSHLNGLVLDGSGRLPHLKTRPASSFIHESQTRRHISEPPKCPRDRDEFHSSFSLLINLGTEAKKDKEKKMSSYKRQMSVELEQWRATVIEQIWLELRAYLGGKSPEEQLQLLKMERQESEKVIDDINNFCFADSVLEEHTDDPYICDFKSNGTSVKGNNTSYRELVSRSVSASFIDLNLTDETVRLQEKALFQMQYLLNRLDHYENCYSTTESCMKDNAKFRDPDFQRRVKCLNLWLNITCDLCQKLKLFGRIIGAHSRGIQWPFVNFEFPKPHTQDFLTRQKDSTPSVMETEHTESSENEETNIDEEEEEDLVEEEEEDNECVSSDEAQQGDNRSFLSPNLKQVKFKCGDDDSSGQSSPVSTPTHHHPSTPVNSSTPLHFPQHSSSNVSNIGASVLSLSRASSEVSLDDSRTVRSSIYRHYAEKCLRKMGLQKLNVRLRDLFHGSLSRAKEALERPKETIYSDIGVQVDEEANEHVDVCRTSSNASSESSHPHVARGSSLSEHGEWSSQFILMGLPSFRPTYLFIVRIQLDVIHECLKLRKDQRPIGDPSFLSIRQLIRECKEVLKGATLVKQYYHYMVAAVMWDDELEAETQFETDLTEFDEDMKSMLDVYFGYLQSWIYMLQALPEASLGMKSALEEEWTYTKSICAYVIGGEAEAGKKFSSLASSLLNSIGDFLENGIDDNTRSLFDVENADYGADDENDDEEEYYSGDENDSIEDRKNFKRIVEMKQNVQGILRNFKNLFNEARERASKALGFAKLLRKDLEIAADFNITVTTQQLFARLIDTHHVQVKVQLSAGYLMFIPESIVSNKQLILQLLNVTSGREDPTDLTAKEDGYLLMIRCDGQADDLCGSPGWTGMVINVEPTAETAIALSHIEVMSLLFVVTHSGTLAQQRKYFETIMGRKVRLVNEQTSCHQSIAESLSELKTNAVDLMVKISQAIHQVNEKLNLNNIILHEESILKLYRETMLKIYDFGFEYQRELMRLVSRDQREKMCQMTVSFAKDWMNFVIDKCERGRGTRPRWATQGLEFITIACEPKNIVYLTDDEFQDFQRRILDCLTHIIGSSDNRHIAPGRCSQHQHFSAADGVLGKIALSSLPLISERPAPIPARYNTTRHCLLPNRPLLRFERLVSDLRTVFTSCGHGDRWYGITFVYYGLSLSRSNLDLPRSCQPSVHRLISCPEHSRFSRSNSSRSVQSEPSERHTSSLTSTPSGTGNFFFGDSRGTRHSIPELPEISIMGSSEDGRLYLVDVSQARRGSRGLLTIQAVLGEIDRSRPRNERLAVRIEKLEASREHKLREKRVIGMVTNCVQEPDYRINVRRVNFRWQRGIKIGEGQFGKVYTAVNINSGELMAMKEMKFQPNDQQSLKEICDEIKNFEGINHKNLVKYYGVEVHKDEMLMFMEYCDSGSIEEVARIGLPEYMIRRYTQEIVRAIAHLHENNIVHRDIKGANIFLTSQGHVKLGDFGCSVKLKNQQTMPGENVNLVGTTAYMAPEVITQNKQEGYGRAADIWSLGCVVIEMATGKRPWHELEHNLQVMFKVGTGHTPPIPDCLGKEGKSFLNCCLVHEPDKRWTAVELLDHIFVKCYDDVEENGDEDDSR